MRFRWSISASSSLIQVSYLLSLVLRLVWCNCTALASHVKSADFLELFHRLGLVHFIHDRDEGLPIGSTQTTNIVSSVEFTTY